MASHVYAVDLKSHEEILKFARSTHRGTLLIISAINTCRVMLKQEKVRNAFKTVAEKYSKRRLNSWYLQGSSPMDMDQVADTFIQKILATFPQVFVDYALKNPDNRGFHIRRPWDGNFEPGRQAISISGRNVDLMSTAFSNAFVKGKGIDENSLQLFRAFLFMTTNTFLHELGHVFVTYLSKGREETPCQINTPSENMAESKGEAGQALEYWIFDGTIEHYHNPVSSAPDDQCGTAYLKKKTDADHRILRKAINDTVSFKFNFPYAHEESEDRGDLRSLGRGFAEDTLTDPLGY